MDERLPWNCRRDQLCRSSEGFAQGRFPRRPPRPWDGDYDVAGRSGLVDEVPNTSPPLTRYVLKDGAVEKQQDTQQPATVPAVAAAAMAAVNAAVGKNALLPGRPPARPAADLLSPDSSPSKDDRNVSQDEGDFGDECVDDPDSEF